MNTFNRVMMVIVILAVFVVATIGLVVPGESLLIVKGVVDSSLYMLGRIRPEYILPFRALLVLCAAFLDVLLIGLLAAEIRRPRHVIPVEKVGGGTVAVTVESLAERLGYHLNQIADVIGVKVKVTARGRGVDLVMNIQTGADVNVPEKAGQVLEVARQVVEDKMGLKLAREPRVYIHAMPYPGLVARPISGPPAPLPPTSPRQEGAPAAPPGEPPSPFHRVTGEG